MRLVTPERWYIAFWIILGLLFLYGQYFVLERAIGRRLDRVIELLQRIERQ